MKTLKLFLFVCSIMVISSLPTNPVEFECDNCNFTDGFFFIKTIFFPLAPYEYQCINDTRNISIYTIVVEIVCKPEDCVGVGRRELRNIISVDRLNCSDVLYDTFNQPKTLNVSLILVTSEEVLTWGAAIALCKDSVEGLMLLALFILCLIKGTFMSNNKTLFLITALIINVVDFFYTGKDYVLDRLHFLLSSRRQFVSTPQNSDPS
jgi:hypothetical protein